MAAAPSVRPEDRPEWTHALIAAKFAGTGISASQADRILADLELWPHKVRGWLRRRRRPVLGPGRRGLRHLPPSAPGYRRDLHRRETGIQAKYREYPGRRPAPARPGPPGFEYVRTGTVSIIAALPAGTGQVIVEPVSRNDSI